MDTVGIGIVGAGKIFEQHAMPATLLQGAPSCWRSPISTKPSCRKAAGKYSIPFAAARLSQFCLIERY